MNKKILVIGSVTAAEYQPLRIEFIRSGHKPMIVHDNADNFLLNTEGLLQSVHRNLCLSTPEHLDEVTDELVCQLASLHLDQYGRFAAIIFSDDAWQRLCEYHYICQALESRQFDFDQWVIEDGRPQFAGRMAS